MRETLLQHADPSQRLHLDVRRRPMCAGFLVPDHRPSHLRKLNAVWRGHRRRCEPEGLEHFRNEVDQNCLKLDSGGRNPFDPTNLIVGWSPNAQEHRIETTDPNAGLNPFDLKTNRLKTNRLKIATNSSPNRCCHLVTASLPMWDGQNSRSSIGSKAGPTRDQPNRSWPPNRPWIRPSSCPLPDLTSPMDARRLEGRLICPSATNWKRKDWPCDQPTGPRPQP
jgi:hypothetical protein